MDKSEFETLRKGDIVKDTRTGAVHVIASIEESVISPTERITDAFTTVNGDRCKSFDRDVQYLARIIMITETRERAIEAKITERLTARGIRAKEIQAYVGDIHSCSEIMLYEDMSEFELWIDYQRYVEA